MSVDQLKLGIVGLGFVGDAVHNYFKDRAPHLNTYDKFRNNGIGTYGIGTLDSILETDLVYLCLPTLYETKLDSYNVTAIEETLTYLSEHSYEGIILIKSTVEPGRTTKLTMKYNLKIIHNPEFLTARTAREDFAKQGHIVLGITETVTPSDVETVQKFYNHYFPNAKISVSTSTESESMKIFVNSFYSVKVQIFNEFYLLCQQNGADYSKVLELMLENGWINPMHTQVPGPDGQLSYGGACFPKDTQALLATMKRAQTPHAVLEATVQERNTMRSD